MGSKIKKSIAVVLIATFLMSMFVIAPGAAETENDELVFNNNNYSFEGNNSVGNLIADEINDHQSNQISSNGEYLITGLEVNKNVATVNYIAKDICTILVAIYDENNGEMIASGKSEVSADESEADVKIGTENMPESFVVKAFMLNESNAPLSNPYCSEMYTSEIQELKRMTADDFESEDVFNFDDDNATNFGVYSDDVKKVVSNENTNIIQSADEENIKYVFDNADESLKSLKPGDIFTCGDDTNNPIILKIGTISVDGDTVTIYGDETSLEEVFEYVKIEGRNDTENAEIDDSTMSEGVTYSGRTVAPVGAINVDTTAKQKIEFDILTGKRIEDEDDDNGFSAGFSATAGIYAEAALEIYMSMSRQVFDFMLSVETTYSISLEAKYKYEVEFATLSIPVLSKVITVDFTPGAYFEADAALKIDFTAGVIVGFGYSDEDGFYNNCQPPHADCELKLEGKLEFGLSLKLAVVVGKKWIGQAGLEGKVGFELSGAPTKTAEIEEVTVKHNCTKCFSGDITFAITITPFVEVFKDDILQDVFDTELEISIKPGDKPLATWYYSFDNKKGGFGSCPYMDYIIPIKVIKNGSSLSYVSVMEYESLNKNLGQTDVDGRMEMRLPGTKTGLYLISVDNAHVSFSIKDDDVQVLENGKWCSISEAENFQNHCYIIDVPLDPPPTEPDPTEPETTEPEPIDPEPTSPEQEPTEPEKEGIEWTLEEGILNIEGSGPMDDYMGGQAPWWDALGKEKITQVKISDGITSIGSFAFCNFSNLQSVTIPDSVISIGDCAFMACESLENIKMSKNVKEIGESAFLSCYSLTSIELPSGIKCIEKMAFENTGLVSIEIPYGVKSIEERAFFYCDSLNSVTIPNSVTSIGSFAFANCYRLKNVIIPDSVTDIGDSAFADTGILSEVSCSNVNVNFDSFGIYSEYSNKIANADYIIAVVKDPNAEDILSAENLLYVDQFTADNDGKISVSLPVSSDTKDYETVLFGPEKAPIKGDVNSDGKVGIDDVTYIQKYLANLAEFTEEQMALADVNKDGEVNIDDATLIQKHLVGMAVIE